MKRKILVTGATGLLGGSIVQKIDDRHDLYLVVRNQKEHQEILGNHHSVIEADITDPHFISSLPKKIDSILHLVQSEHYREFPEKAEDIFSVNTLSTLQLLEYARKAQVGTFVLASSGIVYGKAKNDQNFREEDPVVFEDSKLGFYHTSKLCAEAIAKNYTEFMNIVVARLFFAYGPRQSQTMLIPRLVDSIKNQKSISLSGENGIVINPIYVEDAAESFIKAASLEEGGIINIAGNQQLSLREICKIIAQEVGEEPLFQLDPSDGLQVFCGDITKMKKKLITPSTPFREGIKRYINESQLISETSLSV